jgi:hypothetical protein
MIATRGQPRSRPRRRCAAVLGALMTGALLLSACGGGGNGSSSTTSARTTTRPATTTPAAADLVAHLQTPGRQPKAGGHWPITVTLTWQGKPARGHISYEFLLGGQVVSRQQVGGEPATFTGTFHDDILWPDSAVGYTLTFRVVVTSPHGTKNLDYPVRVRRR